jgi:hypothetical protein
VPLSVGGGKVPVLVGGGGGVVVLGGALLLCVAGGAVAVSLDDDGACVARVCVGGAGVQLGCHVGSNGTVTATTLGAKEGAGEAASCVTGCFGCMATATTTASVTAARLVYRMTMSNLGVRVDVSLTGLPPSVCGCRLQPARPVAGGPPLPLRGVPLLRFVLKVLQRARRHCLAVVVERAVLQRVAEAVDSGVNLSGRKPTQVMVAVERPGADGFLDGVHPYPLTAAAS